MTENLVLVNENDEEIGVAEKLDAHRRGLLHRAISVVLFRAGDPALMLLQQRAAGKYHCPLMWANACCSHPRPGEAPLAAAHRRLGDELNLAAEAPLTPVGAVLYRAPVGDLVEHEYDYVFAGFIQNKNIPFNPAEVAAAEWIDVNELLRSDFSDPLRKYVPWLEKVVYKALEAGLSPAHKDILRRAA